MTHRRIIVIITLLILLNSAGLLTLRQPKTELPIPTLDALATTQPLEVLNSVELQPTSIAVVSNTVNEADSEASETSNTAVEPVESVAVVAPSNVPTTISAQPVENSIVLRFREGASQAERDTLIASVGGVVESEITALNAVVIQVIEPLAATAALENSPIIVSSEPDYIVTALQEVYNPPNDELFTQQWALTAIEATQSWAALPANAPTVTVAVIDSGICYNHPDLSGRILATGYDFVEGDTVAQDEANHGCPVAGIIAANMNNTIGIAGVAPNTQILPLRVLDANATGRYSDVANAIIYAVDNGAQVINLSLGGSNPSSVLEAAVNYAAVHNVMMVAAVGNSSGTVPMYPAAYTPVISVGAYDANYTLSSFNNQGYDVVAPGVNILTTDSNGSYQSKTGTSFAAPHIAAQKALELVGVPIETVVLPEQPPVVTTIVPPLPDEERAPLRIMIPAEETEADIRSLAQRFPNLDIAESFSFGPRMDAVTGQAGDFNLLTILVRFSDKANSVTATSFDSFIYGTTRPNVRHYYREISYNNLDIVTVDYPSSLSWRLAPQTYAYYVNNQNCFGSYPNNCQKLAEDIALAVDPLVDFTNYDNDNDGYVDAIFIVHTGTGGEWTGDVDDIWSHQWSTVNEPIVDGKRVSTYVTAPEYWDYPGDITIGVYVHELAHAFGLPDFYDVQADEFGFTSSGIGDWSLMAGGSWNWDRYYGNVPAFGSSPAHPDPYSRTYLGWTTPINMTGASGVLAINSVEQNSNAVYRMNNPYNSNEYFLLENRQWLGYDNALPGEGLLIWHIDQAWINQSNSYECLSFNNWECEDFHFGIALEQADGWRDLEFGFAADAGDPFPGSSNRTSFNFTTFPNTSSYYSQLNPGINLSSIGIISNRVEMVMNSPAPIHNNFANAKLITHLVYTDSLFTNAATTDTYDPASSCDAATPPKTVWYRYTPSSDEEVIIDTIGSNYDTVLSVWTGTSGNLTAVDCNDDFSGDQSQLTLNLTGGTQYYIRVAGAAVSTSRLVFNITVEPPPNDLFANAIEITALPYTDTQDTRGASSTGESKACGELGLGVWYTYTPPVDQTVTFDTIGSDYDTVLVIYRGSTGNVLECNDDEQLGIIRTSKITTDLVGGTTYYILAGGWQGENGELVINAVLVPSDLVFTSFDAVPDHTLAGETNVSFTISNTGAGIAGATTAQLVLSDDATIGNGDDVAVTTVNIPAIAAGGQYTNTVAVALPVDTLYAHASVEDPIGQPLGTVSTSADTLAMLLDSANVVDEVNENNNEGTDDITYFGWDANRDIVVSPADAIYAINRLTGTDALADIDGNGTVETADVDAIVNRFGYERNEAVDEIAPTEPPAPPSGSNVRMRYEIITSAPSMHLMQPSDTFDMNIYVEDIRNITPQSVYSAYLNLTYNPSVLILTGATTYGANFAGNTLLLEAVSAGSITNLGATSSNLTPSSGTLLVTLNFEVTAYGNTQLSMSTASSPLADITVYGNDNEQVNSTQFVNSALWIRQLPTATPLPTDTPIPTSTALPNAQTVGLFSDGIWTFRDSNTTGMADVRFQFGTAETGWIPIVGDWDGDDVDGIGLYRNGTFILRDNSSAGAIEYIVTLGVSESGWQPVAGDWDGDGIDSVGLYKNGLWLLTNANQRNAPIAHRVSFNPFGILASTPIAGDWNDSARDGIGLYYNGSFTLLNNLTGSPLVTNFSFGPRESGWKPLAGDWDGDGRDTVGIYKDGLWRLRNSNSTGTPDIGFTFRGNGTPVANYRGGMGGLLALAASLSIPVETEASPTATVPVETTSEVIEPVEVTAEVTVEIQPTEEPTATLDIPTETPTETATSLSTETPVPTATSVPTETPAAETPPETTEEASP